MCSLLDTYDNVSAALNVEIMFFLLPSIPILVILKNPQSRFTKAENFIAETFCGLPSALELNETKKERFFSPLLH